LRAEAQVPRRGVVVFAGARRAPAGYLRHRHDNVMPADPVNLIGRFEIARILGKGAQGSVYLARDPHLQRQVAIKAIGGGAAPDKIRRLLQEARIVSQFSHPNIVTLFDAIEHDGNHYLILEYVDGATLAQLLRREGRFEAPRAVKIAIQIADGLIYAHGKQVIHRDIKPANIMIDAGGTARIMDFGIAAAVGETDAADSMQGTPRYMAPERLNNKAASESTDVFSLGLVLYEMLTGKPAVSGVNIYEVMHKIANEPFQPPSKVNPAIDETLDHLVLKALLKNDTERYTSAAMMKQALEDYLAPAPESPPATGGGKGTLDFLLRRMRHKSNFPALSQTISTINRVAADSDESVQALSAALLKDFALTNKLLRLVNSSNYGQFGGNISTISRAVMILGFNAVRDLAITLILFEHLQNKAQASQLKEAVIAAYFTGIMAHRVAGLCGVADSEEGFICGVFQHLGKLLATYYFYDESTEIVKRMQRGESEDQASRGVLGISHEELGIGIARSWNLPEKIVTSMQVVSGPQTQKSPHPADKLKLVANLAVALCRVASDTAPAQKTVELEKLGRQFGGSLNLGKKQYGAVVEESVQEFLAESSMFVTETNRSRVLNSIKQWSHDQSGDPPSPAAGAAANANADTGAATVADSVDDFVNRTATLVADTPVTDNVDSAATLTAGIQDITNTLVGDYNLNDVLRIILETMYRGMSFSQVLLCTRDIKNNRLQARFGFGAKVEELLKHFSVPLGQPQDVFQIALAKNVDLFIADTRAENIASRIPAWYREKINAQAFLLLPIVINKKVVGMFYADRDNAGELQIEPQQLRLLKTLRNQAVLAIRQKY
jgi:eukaryotic-like serine/threonine-protein kinase